MEQFSSGALEFQKCISFYLVNNAIVVPHPFRVRIYELIYKDISSVLCLFSKCITEQFRLAKLNQQKVDNNSFKNAVKYQ